jgi:transposase
MGVGTTSGAYNTQSFEEFVAKALLPQLPPGSVLILDNARIHHGPSLKVIVEAAGCHLLYLPPYSPDFSPLELVWSWLKDQVRKQAPRTDEQRQRDILQTSLTLPTDAATGWFQKCGILHSEPL